MKTMYKLRMFNATKNLIMQFANEETANKQAEEEGIKAGLLIEITAETLFEEKDIISEQTIKQYM